MHLGPRSGYSSKVHDAMMANTPEIADMASYREHLPWIVPRLQRRRETYDDLDSFFDRWQHLLGAALIEAPPPFAPSPAWPADILTAAVTPPRVMHRELLRRMWIFSDGSVPLSELDVLGEERVGGGIMSAPLADLWQELIRIRRERIRALDADDPRLRTYGP
jgi:hypothetical protein